MSKMNFLDAEMTLELAEIYSPNCCEMRNYFGDNIYLKALKWFKLRDFANFEYLRRDGSIPSEKSPYFLIRERVKEQHKIHNTKAKGRWEETIIYDEYITPDRYRINESKLIRACLYLMFPYLYNYKFDVYHFNDTNNEIYIHIDNMTLYVPLKALKEKDFSIVIDRERSYVEYYSPKTPEWKEKEAKISSSKEIDTLSKYINGELRYKSSPEKNEKYFIKISRLYINYDEKGLFISNDLYTIYTLKEASKIKQRAKKLLRFGYEPKDLTITRYLEKELSA